MDYEIRNVCELKPVKVTIEFEGMISNSQFSNISQIIKTAFDQQINSFEQIDKLIGLKRDYFIPEFSVDLETGIKLRIVGLNEVVFADINKTKKIKK